MNFNTCNHHYSTEKFNNPMLKPQCFSCETFTRLYVNDTLVKKEKFNHPKKLHAMSPSP